MNFISSSKGVFNDTRTFPIALTLHVVKCILPTASQSVAVAKDNLILPARSNTRLPSASVPIPNDAPNILTSLLVGLVLVGIGLVAGIGLACGKGTSHSISVLGHAGGDDDGDSEDTSDWDDGDTLNGDDGPPLQNGGGDHDHGDGGEPDEPADGSGVDDIPSSNSPIWQAILFALSIGTIYLLINFLFSTCIKRLISIARHCLSTLPIQDHLHSAIHGALDWFESHLLELCNELFWIRDHDENQAVALGIGKRSLGVRPEIFVYSMDDLHEFKHLIFSNIKTTPSAAWNWIVSLCSSAAVCKATDKIISRLCNILSAAAAYGVIAVFLRMALDTLAHYRGTGRNEGRPLISNAEELPTHATFDFGSLCNEGQTTFDSFNSAKDHVALGPEVSNASDASAVYNTALSISISGAWILNDTSKRLVPATSGTERVEEDVTEEEGDRGYYVVEAEGYDEEAAHGSDYPNDEDTEVTADESNPNNELNVAGDKCGGYYVPEEDYYEEEALYGNEYPCDEDNEEDEDSFDPSDESRDDCGHYIAEEEYYEEEALYGDEYPCDNAAEDAGDDPNLNDEPPSVTDEECGYYVPEEDCYEEEALYGDEYPCGDHDDGSVDEGFHPEIGGSPAPGPDDEGEGEGEMDMELDEIHPVIWYYGCQLPTTPANNPSGVFHFNTVTNCKSPSPTTIATVQTCILQRIEDDKVRLAAAKERATLRVLARSKKLAATRRRAKGKIQRPARRVDKNNEDIIDLEKSREKYLNEYRSRMAELIWEPFPPSEPIDASDTSIYFMRRPSTRFHYTEEDSFEARKAEFEKHTDRMRSSVRKMRGIVEADYSPGRYDCKQLDEIARWRVELERGKDDLV